MSDANFEAADHEVQITLTASLKDAVSVAKCNILGRWLSENEDGVKTAKRE